MDKGMNNQMWNYSSIQETITEKTGYVKKFASILCALFQETDDI